MPVSRQNARFAINTFSLPEKGVFNPLYSSPIWLLCIATGTVLFTNSIERIVIFYFRDTMIGESFLFEVFLDLILFFPIIYLFIFRPFSAQIRERYQVEEAIRENEENLRAFFDNCIDGLLLVSPTGEILESNQEACRIFNISEKKVPTINPGGIFDPSDSQLTKLLNECIQSGKARFELTYRRQDSHIVIIDTALSKFTDRHRQQIFSFTFRDITDQQRILDQVHKLSSAIEYSPSAIIITDRRGFIEYVNPGFTRMTGFEYEDIIGKKPENIMYGPTSAKEHNLLWDTISAGLEWHGEFRSQRKSGENYWEANAFAPIFGPDGNITHYVGVKEDITARKQIEEELRDSRQRLRSLSTHLQNVREEERSAIGREIHDELGQVLATVQMGVTLLANEYCDHQHLTKRISGMEQLLVGAIQSVQKISAQLRPAILEMLGLTEAIEWQTKEFQKNSGIICIYKLSLGEETISKEISTAFYRIFQEALTNILRHAEATRVDIFLKSKKDDIVLIIKDNGRGITSDQIRAHLSLGILGMSERAYALGGRVKIFGTKPRGTVVFTRIPIRSQRTVI